MSVSATRAVIADGDQRRPDKLRIVREGAIGRVGLDGDDAHRVRDLVVQVARDPGPLLGHRRMDAILTEPLEHLSAQT